MTTRLYILPAHECRGTVRTGKRPAYVAGLAWSGIDAGPLPWYLAAVEARPEQHAALRREPEVIAIGHEPPRRLPLPVSWASSGHEAAERFAALCLVAQAYQGQAGVDVTRSWRWTEDAGRVSMPIDVGPVRLLPRGYLPPWQAPSGWARAALPATDAFTAANGTVLTTYSANWAIASGSFAINTNAVYANSAGNECMARWTTDAFNANQYAQATLSALGATDTAIGVACRVSSSADTGYGFYTDSLALSGRYLYKLVAGTWTQLANTTPPSAGVVLRIEAEGTAVRAKIDGVQWTSVTDAAIASGSAGLAGYNVNTANRVDDWEGGDIAGAAGGQPMALRHTLDLTGPRGWGRGI